MPKTASFESRISAIVAAASKEIAAAVQQSFDAQIAGIVTGAAAKAGAPAAAVNVTAKRKPGRPPKAAAMVPAVAPAALPKRRGRPPKAKTAAAVPAVAAPAKKAKKKRSWPDCSQPGCKNKMFPGSGSARLCYEHFVASGGKHYAKK